MNTAMLKTPGIPFFVTVYGGLLALIGTFLGIAALFNPSMAVGYIEGADMIAGAWAGRTLGMALVLALAIGFRNPQVYVLAFLGSVCREAGDVVGAFNSGSTNLIPVLAGFLLLDAICLVLSLRALKAKPTD